MPHINRIRVNNVKYNFGTQFYDDFIMRFDGRNALYDLANGGGKSVLMLLLFQNLIPNCTLDDKQPVEKLFRTGDGSTTIHSLIEWTLDEDMVKDGYKYMLTGFCARKAREDHTVGRVRDAASIEYFNYVIFYREYNDNDLVNLPLKKGKERITWPGLKAYLKELSHSDYNLSVRIFERKGEYQRFIGQYGLYESSWEIIRGINKTEGHVRTYFETNYRTTRKVIEDLLIEEIIQKAFVMKARDGQEPEEGDMARNLLDIKDKLMELSARKEEISGYDHQISALNTFAGRVDTLRQLYLEEEDFCVELIKIYNTAVSACRRKEKDLAAARKEGEFAWKHMGEIRRKLETVKIQESRERLRMYEANSGRFEKDKMLLTEKRDRLRLNLNHKLSMNDWQEYVSLEQKIASVREAMDHVGTDHGELLEKLKRMAARQRVFYNERRQQWDVQCVDLRKSLRADKDSLSSLQSEHRMLDNQLAVAEDLCARNEAAAGQEQKNLTQLRSRLNSLLVEGSEKELKKNRARQRTLKDAVMQDKGQLDHLYNEIQSCRLRLESIGVLIDTVHQKKAEIEGFFKAYEHEKIKADRLRDVYKAGNYYELRDAIYERYKKVILDIYDLGQKTDLIRSQIEALRGGNPSRISDGQRELINYIRRQHGATCIPGSDYICGLDNEGRQALLKKMPYLPWSVIVKDNFTKIAEDEILYTKDFGAYTIPVLGLDAVLGDCLFPENGHIIFVSGDGRLYYDSETLSSKLTSLESQLDRLGAGQKRLLDNEKTYMSDIEYMGQFLVEYEVKYEENAAAAKAEEKRLHALELEKKEFEKHCEALKGAMEATQKQIADANAQLEVLAADEQTLISVWESEQHLDEINEALRVAREQKHSCEARLAQSEGMTEALEHKIRSCNEKLDNFSRLKENQEKLWDEMYSAYAVSGEKVENDSDFEGLDSDGLHAGFCGIRQVFEKEHTDFEDKKQLAQSYEMAMARIKERITERSVSADELRTLYEQGECMQTSQADLEALREQLSQVTEQLAKLDEMAEAARVSRDRLFGNVENAISVIEEKYGSYTEIELKNKDFGGFIRENQAALQTINEKYSASGLEQERLEKELKAAEDIRKDLERLIRTVKVNFNLTKDFYSGSVNLKKRCEELTEMYERFGREEERKREAFEKDRLNLAGELNRMNACELADEISSYVQLPKTVDETKTLTDHIQETIQIIDLEKGRISRGIEDMTKIKEQFENQCLQRCIDIRTELERFPKLSQIMQDGEPLPVIQLKIPYVREEFYGQQMSAYIDQIVATVDAYTDNDEKLKYIRQKLSWKNLFSVIVSDMNGIRLNLYKRERIREQSRYLRYEEAVGSTGQSQGIYIQFLIAVINYISALNARGSDGVRAGKVIFIDNPFGAAKDIYIWEPIFELLKANNVQLIVPARGATPAISGRFDVNYVLGQKMIDHRQQTVVVDYHSNIETDALEYVKIDFEQEVFDFI